jgi:hypothetical protein
VRLVGLGGLAPHPLPRVTFELGWRRAGVRGGTQAPAKRGAAPNADFALVMTNWSDVAGCADRPVLRRSGRRTAAGITGRRR